MIKLLDTEIYVGNMEDSKYIDNEEWAVVHATQTFHYSLFGWNRTTNKPDKKHPNYIYYENENTLSLNWVDGGAYLYKWSGIETFIKIMDFIDKWIDKKKVLVHCDKGYSRSPSLCLLYLAKRNNRINNNSFDEARIEFEKIYPEYNPGGIAEYIRTNWKDII